MEEKNEEEEKRTTKASTWMSWLKKMWITPTGTQSRVQHEEKEDPRTGTHKDPDEADKKNIGPMHEEKRFSCTVCTNSFTGRDQLKTHLARHTEKKDFMCDDCGEQCNREDELGKHGKRRHKEGGNMTCPHCQKIFTDYPYIREHIRPTQKDARGHL